MVAAHNKKNKHSVLCVTSVYLRDITNTFSPVLCLNVSHLSNFLSCLYSCPLQFKYCMVAMYIKKMMLCLTLMYI